MGHSKLLQHLLNGRQLHSPLVYLLSSWGRTASSRLPNIASLAQLGVKQQSSFLYRRTCFFSCGSKPSERPLRLLAVSPVKRLLPTSSDNILTVALIFKLWRLHATSTLADRIAHQSLPWLTVGRLWRFTFLVALFGSFNSVILIVYFISLGSRTGGYLDWHPMLIEGASVSSGTPRLT